MNEKKAFRAKRGGENETRLPSKRTKQSNENGNKQTTCFVRIDIDHKRIGCDCFHYVNVVQVERVRVVQHFGQLGHQFELGVHNLPIVANT